MAVALINTWYVNRTTHGKLSCESCIYHVRIQDLKGHVCEVESSRKI